VWHLQPGAGVNVDELIELEQIKRLKYKYVRCLDQKRWDEIVECFTEDAVAAYSGGKYSFDGRDAIVEFLRTSMGDAGFLSSHRVTQPEIDLVDSSHATGTWALNDEVLVNQHGVRVRGAAFYRDRYVKVDGAWRIASTGYDRTFEEIVPLDKG
jgi:hypothetical protein